MGIKKMDQLRISEVILKSKTNSHFGRGHKNYKLNGDAFNNNYSFPMLQVRKKIAKALRNKLVLLWHTTKEEGQDSIFPVNYLLLEWRKTSYNIL